MYGTALPGKTLERFSARLAQQARQVLKVQTLILEEALLI
jgi:hypothetical protein